VAQVILHLEHPKGQEVQAVVAQEIQVELELLVLPTQVVVAEAVEQVEMVEMVVQALSLLVCQLQITQALQQDHLQ